RVIEKRVIEKGGRPDAEPNLRRYEETVAAFSWREARATLDGLPDGAGLNIAHEAVDRHAAGANAAKTALRCLTRADASTLSYAELRALTNRFANVLRGLQVGAGERVFALAPRAAGLYVAALGTLKNRSVFSPL